MILSLVVAKLNLEWIEEGRLNTRRIELDHNHQPTKVARVGRDPSRCDLVMTDGSVSGLHVEIGFSPESQRFYLRNLRESNPPIVNNQPLVAGQVLLQAENTIQLGNVQLRAIATYDSLALPATDIQIPAPQPPIASSQPVGPQVSAPVGLSQSPPQGPFHYANPNLDSSNPNVVADTDLGDRSNSIWLLLGFVTLLLILVAMAWPNVSGFLGIGRERVISESNSPTDEPVQANDENSPSSTGRPSSAAELEPYSHPTGLFKLEVPKNWEFLDNSQPGNTVIQAWSHPTLNTFVIVRILASSQELSRSQLQDAAINVVEEIFGDSKGFRREEPQNLLDGSVRVGWETDTGLAVTFVRQDGLNVSILTIGDPKDNGDFNLDIEQIVSSYEVDPSVTIP